MRLPENGYFPQSLRQAQVLILKILNVFLRLKSSSSLILQKISHSLTASYIPRLPIPLEAEQWHFAVFVPDHSGGPVLDLYEVPY